MQPKKRPRKRTNKDPSWRPSDSDDDDDSDSDVGEVVDEKLDKTAGTVVMTTTITRRKAANNTSSTTSAPSAKRRKTTKQQSEQQETKQEVSEVRGDLPATETLIPPPKQQKPNPDSKSSAITSFFSNLFDKLKWLYYEPEDENEATNKNNFLKGNSFSWKELLLHEPLSSGTFGDVFRGTLRGKEVAVKVLKSSDHSDFAKEVNFLSKLQHPNVVKYYGACKDPHKMIIMEFISRGSLHSVIHVEKLVLRDDLPLLCSMAIDILKGLQFLHSQQIIHRDIKPGNLLVDNSNTIKITDFGISRELESSTIEAMTGFVGTVAYMAPELMSYGTNTNALQMKYDYRVDIYSFGVVLWEMLSSKIPFAGMSAITIGFNVTNKKKRPSDFEKDGVTNSGPHGDAVQSIMELAKQSWDANPSKRPTIQQMIERFSQIKEKLVEQKL